jgi:hypothetical protein
VLLRSEFGFFAPVNLGRWAQASVSFGVSSTTYEEFGWKPDFRID